MKINSKPIRGTRDILPDEMLIRDYIEQTILDTYRRYGFNRIETPALENLELLLGSEGGENLKMLFTILKRGEKLDLTKDNQSFKDICDIGLRYDLTLPLSRFFSNNKEDLELPFKSIQIGNVFRAERPQKGRFRSFKQCDIDIIGEPSEVAEIELINTTTKALKAINFNDFTVRINDRRILSSLIEAAGFNTTDVANICITLDKLDKIGAEGIRNELLNKKYEEDKIDKFINQINDLTLKNLCDTSVEKHVRDAIENVINVITSLSNSSYNIVFDPTLVRGMGYYTGLIFEIEYGPYGFAIAGGGRYDDLIGKFSKQSVPAVGFSIGFERIVHIIKEEKFNIGNSKNRVAILYNKDDDIVRVIEKSDEFRKQGHNVSLILSKKKIGKQINQLASMNYKFFMIFGRDNELREFTEGA